MTATAPPGALLLPELLPHQQAIAASPARFKVVRAGRRFGKDILDFLCAVLGHGPAECSHEPGTCQRSRSRNTSCWAGLVHGFDVVWLSPDFPQAQTLWHQEIRPRFQHLPAMELNASDHSLRLPNGARLWLRSYENVASIRGMGKQLAGIICNEAGHFDLQDAWRSVLAPTLLDHRGWALFTSTPNSGLDGNPGHETPSYFNRLCLEIAGGQRGPEWAHFQGDARDNPTIEAAAFRGLVAEYQADSPRLREEVYAELLEAGSGLALPWEPSVHVIQHWEPMPEHVGERYIAGMDWGSGRLGESLRTNPYDATQSKSVIACGAIDTVGSITWYKEFVWTGKEAYQAGWDWAQALIRAGPTCPWPSIIYADGSMWGQDMKRGTGKSIGDEFRQGADAVLERHTIPIQPAPHGAGSRKLKLSMMQRMLRWGPRLADGTVPVSRQPRMRFVGSGCPYLCASLPTLPYSPASWEDIDTDADDHCLVGSTSVETSNGPQRIDQICVGELVWTRGGLCTVRASRRTKPWVPVYDVVASDGRSVRMTANHPVWVPGTGFVRCDALRSGDLLLDYDAWRHQWSCRPPSKVGAESGSTCAVAGISVGSSADMEENTSIGGSGRTPSAPFQMDGTSTIAMRIVRTTAPRTWSRSKGLLISAITPTSRSTKPKEPPGATTRESTPERGMPVSPGNNGLWPHDVAGNGAAGSLLVTARDVADEWSGGRPERRADSVGAPALRVTAIRPAGFAAVYNLQVEGAPEFFAGGILVHNSYDAVGMVLLQELDTAERPLYAAADSQHPGFMADGRRRPRVETWESRREEELVRIRQLGVKVGGRYGLRPGKEW